MSKSTINYTFSDLDNSEAHDYVGVVRNFDGPLTESYLLTVGSGSKCVTLTLEPEEFDNLVKDLKRLCIQ